MLVSEKNVLLEVHYHKMLFSKPLKAQFRFYLFRLIYFILGYNKGILGKQELENSSV